MELIDFSVYPASDVQYGGSERKEAILVPNGGGRPCEYMLKFRKRTLFGMRNNHLSEYLGSRIFEALGYPTQKVFLGLRHGEEVVACKSFVADGGAVRPLQRCGGEHAGRGQGIVLGLAREEVSVRESVTAAQLCLDGRGGFTYVVALMRYIVGEDETFCYELEPNYEVIDLLDSSDFQGIPGFDSSVCKTCYERDGRTPTLIADRAPMANREDLWALLDECGMDFWDPLEWLVRSPRRPLGRHREESSLRELHAAA